MKYKVGNQVVVQIEISKDGSKRIVVKEPSIDSKIIEKVFPVVHLDADNNLYTIIIDDDILGWNISAFHIKYWNVDEKYLGKKFYDIYEQFIIRKK